MQMISKMKKEEKIALTDEEKKMQLSGVVKSAREIHQRVGPDQMAVVKEVHRMLTLQEACELCGGKGHGVFKCANFLALKNLFTTTFPNGRDAWLVFTFTRLAVNKAKSFGLTELLRTEASDVFAVGTTPFFT